MSVLRIGNEVYRRVSADDEYENQETTVSLNGGELRCPAYPEPCTYVRIVDSSGEEIAYWDSLEWQEAPEDVMGALIGAMISIN